MGIEFDILSAYSSDSDSDSNYEGATFSAEDLKKCEVKTAFVTSTELIFSPVSLSGIVPSSLSLPDFASSPVSDPVIVSKELDKYIVFVDQPRGLSLPTRNTVTRFYETTVNSSSSQNPTMALLDKIHDGICVSGPEL